MLKYTGVFSCKQNISSIFKDLISKIDKIHDCEFINDEITFNLENNSSLKISVINKLSYFKYGLEDNENIYYLVQFTNCLKADIIILLNIWLPFTFISSQVFVDKLVLFEDYLTRNNIKIEDILEDVFGSDLGQNLKVEFIND